MKQIIYLVEDDDSIIFAVTEYLQNKGFQVEAARTVAEAKKLMEKQPPSLLILDWNLPDGNGGQICTWLRERWRDLPILFLTVKGDTTDIVKGFDLGADDYITKPFELAILNSRISALLRRVGNTEGRLSCGPITLDKDRIQVFYHQEEIMVSAMEYQLLLLLMENKNHTLPRTRLLEKIWDANGNFVNDNTLTVTMKRLRAKLNNPPCFKTIRSIGYRLEDEL